MKLNSILYALFAISLLSACAPFKPSDKRAAICNELNSQLIFNGSTSNSREAEIANSERELALRSYEANHCDQP